MKQFDFYEFAGILTPGAIILFGLTLIHPDWKASLTGNNLSFSDLGLFVILSYAAGHLVQLLGDIIERLWWTSWGGMPTDWIHAGKTDKMRQLISKEQSEQVLTKCMEKYGLSEEYDSLANIPNEDWIPLVRQIYSTVARAQLAQRVDAFNRTYGLLRGLAAALLVIAAAYIHQHLYSDWRKVGLLILILSACALIRMHLFGRYYARELFVQFLEAP